MKKRMVNLLYLVSLIIGGIVGYVRSDIFLKHYDSFTGVILSSASLSLTALTVFLIAFAVIAFVFCRKICNNCRLSRAMTKLDRIQIALGCVTILISAFYAITSPDGGFFEKTFAVSAVFAIIYFGTALFSVRNTMTDLLSCASVLPAALVLLSIYKTNIRFPNISLFAFEVLAALFLMLGFYYLSAMNFKHVGAVMPVLMTSLALMFSLSSIVTHTLVMRSYLFEPVTSNFSIYYFIGAFLVLLGFTSSPEAEKDEKLIYLENNGILIDNDGDMVSFNPDEPAPNAFTSVLGSHYGFFLGEDELSAVDGYDVFAFGLEDEQHALIYHITTPNGKTILELTYADGENMGEKLIKKIADEYDKIDYLVVKPGEGTEKLLGMLEKKLKFKNVILLSDGEANAESGKIILTKYGNIIL